MNLNHSERNDDICMDGQRETMNTGLRLKPLRPKELEIPRPVVNIRTTRFNIKNCRFCPRNAFMFCTVLGRNSDYFSVQH
jgi:hypothetical protein